MPIQRVSSKQAKNNVLRADPALRVLLPSTNGFNRSNVERMLGRYGMIYVKPVNGTFGKGVIRVEKSPNAKHPYRFQAGETKYDFDTFDEMYAKLLTAKKRKPYLAQQGIELLKHNDRRFDLRVMVQKNPRDAWESTGIIGRLAHPGKIVTNYHAGGKPLPFSTLLAGHMSPDKRQSFDRRLREIGVAVASALEKKYPRLKEIGIDVAVDESHHPWILEVNTLPDPYIFRKLPDRSVFRKIHAYAVAYGRFRKRKREA